MATESDLEGFKLNALRELHKAAANGLHFQLCPFANVTLYALEKDGLLTVDPDLQVRITRAGVTYLGARDPHVFAALFGRKITGTTSTGYRSRKVR